MTIQSFLNRHASFAEWQETWDGVPLAFNAYLSDELPRRDWVGSVRAILFRDDQVLVVKAEQPGPVVGGRCEPGETIEQTLTRETAEETGWRVRPVAVVGFRHIRHTDDQRPAWGRPAPEFFDPLFAVRAEEFDRTLKGVNETPCEFLPLAAIDRIGLDPINLAFFHEAVRKYHHANPGRL